jgi:hypothetical protein
MRPNANASQPFSSQGVMMRKMLARIAEEISVLSLQIAMWLDPGEADGDWYEEPF